MVAVVKGLVERPIVLTYEQLIGRATFSQIVTLECVGNTVAGEFISTARWEGVPLRSLLEEAGAQAMPMMLFFERQMASRTVSGSIVRWPGMS